MYINHKKIEDEDDKYVEIKKQTKTPVKEVIKEPQTDKNKIFVEGMLKRMKQDRYI